MLGTRIGRARKRLGLSLRELADKIDLSHAAIKKYEDDKVIPSSDMLLKLAQALQVKVEYFFRPAQFSLENIQYRKHADMRERQLERITAQILDQVERRIELENLFPMSPVGSFSTKTLSSGISELADAEKLALKLREQWALGLNPIPDLIDLFEEQGIKVFVLENENFAKFDGLYAKVNSLPVIVIADQLVGDRQRFTLAHELAHLLLDDVKLAKGLSLEKLCDRFAGCFLLPKSSLVAILGEHRNFIEPRELSLLKQEFGISMTSILHRAREADIISDKHYRQLRKSFDEKGWTEKEPGEQYPAEKTYIFEQMIFHALAEDYIGEAKAAEFMNMSLASFRALRAMN